MKNLSKHSNFTSLIISLEMFLSEAEKKKLVDYVILNYAFSFALKKFKLFIDSPR